jgi:succinate dehydrogenase/fumarate reductase cytochrome b subunit
MTQVLFLIFIIYFSDLFYLEETSEDNNTLLIIIAVSASLLLVILISCCLYCQRYKIQATVRHFFTTLGRCQETFSFIKAVLFTSWNKFSKFWSKYVKFPPMVLYIQTSYMLKNSHVFSNCSKCLQNGWEPLPNIIATLM